MFITVLGKRLKADILLCSEVLEGSKELRIVLCRDKRSGTQHRTSVVAACGTPTTSAMLARSIKAWTCCHYCLPPCTECFPDDLKRIEVVYS